MSQSNQQPMGSGSGPKLGLLGSRTVAILIMVAGAVGFALSWLVFGDQVLCQLGSTLVTFLGLGLIIYNRRGRAGASAPEQEPQIQTYSRPSMLSTRQMPRGFREEARRRMANPPTEPKRWTPPPPPQEPVPAPPAPPPPQESGLLSEVVAILEGQGARVDVETRHEDRAILHIQAADGQIYTALVQDAPGLVEVAAVRPLFALMNSSGSAGGYLVASGPFSDAAYEWAGPRRIRLVAADELNELSV